MAQVSAGWRLHGALSKDPAPAKAFDDIQGRRDYAQRAYKGPRKKGSSSKNATSARTKLPWTQQRRLMTTPVTLIAGDAVVGFDRAKLVKLLGLDEAPDS